MNTLALAQLDAQLASILKRTRSLQHLNLAIEAEHQHALDESRRLLGAMPSTASWWVSCSSVSA